MPPVPWKMSRAIHRRIGGLAEAEFPREACGLLFGEDGALEVVPMENVQDRLHAADPERHPRTARTAYAFDPGKLLRVLEEKEAASLPLRAIYHSHPDHDAYFSEEDSAFAAPFGEPSYPGVVYLVYSVRSGKAADLKAFDWSEESGAYVEVPVEVE